jgi:hypothetical protein
LCVHHRSEVHWLLSKIVALGYASFNNGYL